MRAVKLPAALKKNWFTHAEAQEALGMSRQTLFDLRQRQELGKRDSVELKYLGNVLIKKTAVTAYLRRFGA